MKTQTMVELKGINHLEMGAHERVDRLFRDALDGLHGSFFETKKDNGYKRKIL